LDLTLDIKGSGLHWRGDVTGNSVTLFGRARSTRIRPTCRVKIARKNFSKEKKGGKENQPGRIGLSRKVRLQVRIGPAGRE